ETPAAPVPDGDGGFTQAWAIVARRVAASVEPTTARSLERIRSNTVSSTASHLVTLRYRRGVTTTMRLTFHDGLSDRVMSITGVHDVNERHRELVLECAEAVS